LHRPGALIIVTVSLAPGPAPASSAFRTPSTRRRHGLLIRSAVFLCLGAGHWVLGLGSWAVSAARFPSRRYKRTCPACSPRQDSQSLVWGQVSNTKGTVRQARLTCAEGYTLTAFFAWHIAQKVVAGPAPPGFQTPAKAYGPDLILEMEGSERELLNPETGHFEPA